MDLIAGERIRLIRDKALELGFDDIGFSPAGQLTDHESHFDRWIDNGLHAGMHYMANHRDLRLDPRLLVEGAHTVISLLTLYNPSQHPLHNDAPVIARYAYGEDYHDILRAKLQALFQFIREHVYPELDGRVFVDSAPVLERAWAQKAGLGWIGKNTHLIHPKLGSYTFISELIVNLPLHHDVAMVIDHCGGCTRCIDACPTAALTPHSLDANRCISYLTIENKGDIPDEYKGQFQNRVFGCDICQELCPWNRKAPVTTEYLLMPKPELMALTKDDWYSLDADRFRQLFKRSAVKRAKYEGLMRNLKFIQDQAP